MYHPLWREDGFVVCNCCWSSPAQSFSGPSTAGLMTTFYSLRFETPPTGGPGPHIYIPQDLDGAVIPQGTRFPFRRLLRLPGLGWRYSTPPPHGFRRNIVVLWRSWSSVFCRPLRNMSPPYSWLKSKPSNKPPWSRQQPKRCWCKFIKRIDFKVLTMVTVKGTVLWDVTPCSLLASR
jgi:hypothetical protein